MSKFYYNWAHFDADVREIVRVVKENDFNVKNVYGIPRGGLVVAVAVSHLLDKPMIFDRNKITKKTLIVDDILDSGKTLKKFYKKDFLSPGVLCLNDKKENNLDATLDNVIVGRMTGGKWIVFPWETNKTSKYDNTVK